MSRKKSRKRKSAKKFLKKQKQRKRKHSNEPLEYGNLEPRQLLAVSSYVGGNLDDGTVFSEGDFPEFTIRFAQLTSTSGPYTAQLDLGNGQTADLLVDQAPNDAEVVFAEHYGANGYGAVRFEDNGDFNFTVTLYDGATVVETYQHPSLISVGNLEPRVAIGSDSSLADTGTPFEIQYTLLDRGDDTPTLIEINWGDGSADLVTDMNLTTATHTYATAGSYQITAQVTDEDGTHSVIQKPSLVHVVGTNSTSVGDLTLDPNIEFVKDDVFDGVVANLANFTAPIEELSTEIFWADGETSTGVLTVLPDGSAEITGQHTYQIYGERAFRVVVTDSQGNAVHDTGTYKIWSEMSYRFEAGVSTGERMIGSFEFESTNEWEQSFYRYVSTANVSGGIEERYETLDGTRFLIYREVIGEEPAIIGDVHGDPVSLTDFDHGVNGAGGDGVFENPSTTIRAWLVRNHDVREKHIDLYRATFGDEFAASIDWGDGSANSDGRISLNGFYYPDQILDLYVYGTHTYTQKQNHVATFNVTTSASHPLLDNEGQYVYEMPNPGHLSYLWGGPRINFVTTEHTDEEGNSFVVEIEVAEAIGEDITIELAMQRDGADGADYLADYLVIPASVTIPANETKTYVTIELIDDAKVESAESFHLDMLEVTSENAVIGLDDRFTGTINDRFELPSEVYFIRTNEEFNDGQSDVTVDLKLGLTRARDEDTVVRVQQRVIDHEQEGNIGADNVASYPADFEFVGGAVDSNGNNYVDVTIPAGQISVDIDVVLKADGAGGGPGPSVTNEPDEFFRVEVTDAGTAAIGTESLFEGVILADAVFPTDPVIPELNIGPVVVSGIEGDTFQIDFSLTDTTTTATVVLRDPVGSATEFGDFELLGNAQYDATTRTLTFTDTASISVPITDDIYAEDLEDFLIDLKSVSGATIGSGDSFQGNIQPSDQANNPPRFTSDNIGEAFIGSTYRYVSTATDDDGGSLIYQIGNVIWPDGFEPNRDEEIQFSYINNGPPSQYGIYTWNPPVELVGKSIVVEEVVWDQVTQPVIRTFEIQVHQTIDNSDPIITSEPDTDYVLTPDLTNFDPLDNVDPDGIALTLANGEEVNVNVSLSPTLQGQLKADIVLVVDSSLSMTPALHWLSGVGEVEGALKQIDDQLALKGVSDVQYGIVLYGRDGYPALGLPIAHAVETGEQDPLQLAAGTDSAHLWGNVDQARATLRGFTTLGDDEQGQRAITRILNKTPEPEIGYNANPQPYEFRDDAVIDFIMVTNEDDDSHSHEVQQEILDSLVGDPEIRTDDILFTSIIPAELTGLVNNGIDSRFYDSGSEWTVEENHLVVTPVAPNSGSHMSLFDVEKYIKDEVHHEYYPEGGGGGSEDGTGVPVTIELFHSWSAEVGLTIHDLGDDYQQKARIVFGPEQVSYSNGNPQLPTEYWYLEVDAKADTWSIGSTEFGEYDIELHEGSSWPDVNPGEQLDVELRQVMLKSYRVGSVQHYLPRYDLFVKGRAIGSVEVPEFDNFGDRTQNSIQFMGLGSHNSGASFDSIRLHAFDFVSDNWMEHLAPDAPTPKNFAETSYSSRRGYYANFGTVDGSVLDQDIIGVDFGGAAYRVLAGGTYEQLPNPSIANAFIHADIHYAHQSAAIDGSVWDLTQLFGENADSDIWASLAGAFTHSFVREVVGQHIEVTADSSYLTNVEPFFDNSNPDAYSYVVTFTGNGGSDVFDLKFVQHKDAQPTEIGRIPVFVNAGYGHDFEVVDAENDEPYILSFDPDFVDANGDVITHGATLTNSGRENHENDRLIWNPTVAGDYEFRVLVQDAAGGIGKKVWTVTVNPYDSNNSPPVIDIAGLALDNDGIPVLPNAEELRGYRYQVQASDIDAVDQDRLRYYLNPTILANGTRHEVPDWVRINRNTGELTGRPSSNDVTDFYVTVVVSDGRLYKPDPNVDEWSAGTDKQTFFITVDSRGHFNTAPEIEDVPDQVVKANKLFRYQLVADDPNEHDDLTFQLVAGPEGMVLDSDSGLLAWVPREDQTGQYQSVTVSVSDGRASTTTAFRLIAAAPNSDPVVDTDLVDGVTYNDYRQELKYVDVDGNYVEFTLLRGPVGMNITSLPDSPHYLEWSQADITAGKHLVGIRANDQAGGVVDRYFYVTFRDNTAPHLVSFNQPSWRETIANSATIVLTSENQITDFSGYQIDRVSEHREIVLDTANVVETQDSSGNFWEYQIPLTWTPTHQGSYDVTLTTVNNNGTAKYDLNIVVNPLVDEAHNQPPVFPDTLVGPFAKDAEVYIPLNVYDPEGHDFTWTIESGLPQTAKVDGGLFFTSTESGLFTVVLKATEVSDNGTTGWGADSTKTYTIAIGENAAPSIGYGAVGSAKINADYSLELRIEDPNPGDELTVTLNQESIDANMSLTPDSQDPSLYTLQWLTSDIVSWVNGGDLPQYLPVVIDVVDNHDNATQVAFNLPIYDPNDPATPLQDYDYSIQAGRFWQMPFQIENNGGRELSYKLFKRDSLGDPTLDPLPEGVLMTSDGLLEWSPSPDLLLGSNGQVQSSMVFEFIVEVTDVDAGTSQNVPMDIQVVDPTAYTNPFIPEIDEAAAPAPTGVTVDQRLYYQPELKSISTDHEDEAIVWNLDIAPDGMMIDSESGLITWVPSDKYLGDRVEVRVRVSAQNAGSSMTFYLDVNAVNRAPQIGTTLPHAWEVGEPMQIPLHAYDPEGHLLVYDILTPSGDPVSESITVTDSGQVEWLSPTAGTHEFMIRVSELFYPASQSEFLFNLEVEAGPINFEPLIVGNPGGRFASFESTFEYQFGVFDKDEPVGEPPVFTLDDSAPVGAAISSEGLFTWTPTMEHGPGIHSFQIAVTDSSPHVGVGDNTRYLRFDLELIDNTAPVITSAASLTAPVATTFVHHIKAKDANGDRLTYSLIDNGSIPTGMTVNRATGELRWQTPNDDVNSQFDIVVAVEDSFGAVTKQTVTVDLVVVDNEAPTIVYYMKDGQGNTVTPADYLDQAKWVEYELWIEVRDNRGVTLPDSTPNGTWDITVANTGATDATLLNQGHGLWMVEFSGVGVPSPQGLNPGLLEVTISANDAAGNTTEQFYRYYVEDETSYKIGKLLNVNEHTEPITDRFEVIGNAKHDVNGNCGKYDLKLTSINDPNDFVYLARNEDANVTNSLLGVIDGTMIPSGQYRLYLEVRCDDGQSIAIQAVDERIIEVKNEARLGNFEHASPDLEVTLGGITIPLIRTYNSGLVGIVDDDGEGGFDSDFSPGWNLNFLQSEITVSHPMGTTTRIDQPFADGTRVMVSLPDGSEHWFSFDPVEIGDSGVFLPFLNSDPSNSNSQLYVQDVDQNLRFVLDQHRGDGTYLSARTGRNSTPANFGSAMVLQTENGLKYIFDIRSGKLTGIEDNNDAKIVISENEDGTQITISALGTGAVNHSNHATGTHLGGVQVGYVAGDLQFTPNEFNGVTDTSEFGVTGTYLEVPLGMKTIDMTPLRHGVIADNNATGMGYLMYSDENVHNRFGMNSYKNAHHVLAVRLDGNQWQYTSGLLNHWANFTPEPTDRLLAEVDFTNDTVVSLEDTHSVVEGIVSGYASGDLVFYADMWGGASNDGEFYITGTQIVIPVGVVTYDVGPVNHGVAVDDAATGIGFMMFSEESVHDRFGGLNTDSADHLIAVRLFGTQWQYTNKDGSGWTDFTPVQTDVLVAKLDFSANTVESFEFRQKVVINRDVDGKVTSIDDLTVQAPDDQSIEYVYGNYDPTTGNVDGNDPRQNLGQVIHRSGEKQSYDYEHTAFDRYITEFYDDADFLTLDIEYYDDSSPSEKEKYGRLKSFANANGVTTDLEFTVDLGDGRKVRVTNTTGNTIEEVVNGRGDVLRVVRLIDDALADTERRYLVTVSQYNLRGLMTHQSKPFYVVGADNRFTETEEEIDWASITTYDEDGRVLTSTDGAGAVTTNTYDDENGVFETIDPHGVTSVRISDPNSGQLLETYTTDGESEIKLNHMRYLYNDFGQQTQQEQIFLDGTTLLQSTTEYDESGFTVWSEGLQGGRQFVAYNTNGSQTHSWRKVTEPDAETILTIVDETVFDQDGVATSTIQYEIRGVIDYDETQVSVAAIKSKIAGYATDSTVTKVSESASTENERGYQIQSRRSATDSDGNETWFESRTVYDANGRVEYQTDEYEDGTAVTDIFGTRNYYDAEGRVNRTDRIQGLEISVSETGGEWSSSVTNAGTIQSYSTTVFDNMGRVEYSTQFSTSDATSALKTTNFYNLKGQTTQTIAESWDGAGTGRVDWITQTVFDAEDRVVLQTDAYKAGDTVFATETLYNDDGEAYSSVRRKGVTVSITADTDPIPNDTAVTQWGTKIRSTETFYDLGRVERSVERVFDATEDVIELRVTEYEYDSMGRQIATVGPVVMLAGEATRHRTETVYDDRGRVSIQRSNILHDLTGEGDHDRSQVQEMRYVYDDAGNVIRTEYDDGSFSVSRYDSLGRKVAESQQVPNGTKLVWSDADNSFVTDVSSGAMGESGVLTGVTHEWMDVQLEGEYLNPVVIATPPTKGQYGWHPVSVRVRNVTSSGFQLRVQEWDYQDGIHDGETVGYMVFEAGEHILPNGSKLVAGNTVMNLDATNDPWLTVDLEGFDETPVVFSQVTTNSDPHGVTTRHQNVSTTGFDVRLQEQEIAATPEHGEEKVGWIAVEPGVGAGFEIDTTLARHTVKTINFTNTYSDAPAFIASIQTFVEEETATVRMTSLSATSAGIIVEEEQSQETDWQHAWETVGYWAIEPGMIGGDQRVVPTRTFEFDAQGRMVAIELPAVEDPADASVTRPRYEYTYDERGQQDSITDPNGSRTEFVFDELGRQTERQLPLHDVGNPFNESFEYDSRGRQDLHISFEGVYTENVYDDVTGRMTEVRYFKNQTNYDAYVNSGGSPDEVRTFGFDDHGRVNEVKHFVAGVEVRSEVTTYTEEGYVESVTNDEGYIRYAYDESGRQTQVAFYGSEFSPVDSDDFDTTTEYSYDELGRLKTVSVTERGNVPVDIDPNEAGDQPDTTSYTYDSVGNLETVTYSTGLIHEYVYDSLNRLEELYHWVDSDQDGIREDGEVKASFDYVLRADGKRIAATETFNSLTTAVGVSVDVTNEYRWNYDDAGRLIYESLDSTDDTLDYVDTFSWDLVGNRLETSRDWGDDVANEDYTTSYVYDANDRLLTETKDYVDTSMDKVVTSYGYDFTQQASKVVNSVDANNVATTVSTQNFTYNLQGRLEEVISETFGSNPTYTVTSYEYDSAGNRVASEIGVDTDGDNQVNTNTRIEYLTDSQNHTGYSQVLQETKFDENGVATEKTVYTIGHDQISQTVFNWNSSSSSWDAGETHYFGTDGHGSVRVLYEALSLIVADAASVAQVYHYDAFGNLLNFASGVTPMTTYLYSGEAFDFNIGQQYLRARFYDPVTGRFNRLDPFAGNSQDPQSFHKYAYVHSDPIQLVDPTGYFGIAGALTSTSAYTIYASTGMGATLFWLAGADPLEGALAGLQLGVGLALAPSLKSKVEAVIVGGFAGSAELMFNVYKGKSIRDAKVWAETFRVFSEGVFESALDAWGIRRYGPGADANDVALVNSMILGARGLVKQVFYDQHTPIQYRLEKIMKYILEGMFSLATANAWFFLPHKVGHQISKKLENVSLDKEFKDTIINGVSDGVLHMARYFVAASASYHTFKK